MSKTIYNQKTATMPGYGIIFPDGYTEGQKLPVLVFLHGIGEITSKKTLQQCVDFHYWLKAVADKKKMICIVPQDDGTSLFDDKEVVALIPVIKQYWNGQLFINGLSRGAGTSMSIDMSNSVLKPMVCAFVWMCPPNWEGMDEKKLAGDDTPIWWFHGAKDVADPNTRIERAINTIDDIHRAGRTKNFYISIFPLLDHYIWETVCKVGVPPINPTNGAKSWKGTNSIMQEVNGTMVSVPVNVEVQCINNPATDIYDWMLAQHKGDYSAPKLLDDSVEAPPVENPSTGTPPPTTTTPVYIKDINWSVEGKFFVINWRDGQNPMKITSTLTKPIKNVYDRFVITKQDPKGHIILTIEYKNELPPLTLEKRP